MYPVLWVQNPGTAYLGVSAWVSHEVVVTLFREAVTIWKAGWGLTCFHDREEASFPHWLLAGDLSSLPWLCVLRTWQLASPRATVPEGAPKMEAAAFYNVTSEVTITSALFCWSHRPTLVQGGRGIHRGGDTRSWGSLGITLKIRYHTQSADSDLVPTCVPGAINWELVTQSFRPWGVGGQLPSLSGGGTPYKNTTVCPLSHHAYPHEIHICSQQSLI